MSYSNAPLPWMYACLFLYGLSHAVGDPAAGALLPQLVPVHLLSNAITWNSSRWQVSSVAGPALGGLALATIHAPAIYLINAICTLMYMFFIAATRPAESERMSEGRSWDALLGGIRFVRENKVILATITLDMFAVLLGGATALLPVFADRILHVRETGFGLLRAAPAVGALCMALYLAHRPPMRHAGKALLWAVGGFGVATIVFGLSRNYWLSLLALAFTGAFDNISVVVRHTLVQILTPDSMRGRVAAVNNVFIGTSNEIGELESGFVGSRLGPVLTVVLGGIGTILVVLIVGAIWPQVRALGSMEEAARKAESKRELAAETAGAA
jgi:predicted MFS family arabinose efflux permease